MGYIAGMIVNGITVAWLVFAIVFFSFPIINLLLVSRLCLLWAVPDRETANALIAVKHELHLRNRWRPSIPFSQAGGSLSAKPYTARMLRARDENEAWLLLEPEGRKKDLRLSSMS